jgi:hypothetical protein
MQIAGFNALDLLLMFIMVLGIVTGMLRGVLPQLFSLVSIWLGLIVTLWFYKPFSTYILQGLGLPRVGSDTMAFLILFLIFFNGIRLLVKTLSKPPEERKLKKKSKFDPLAEAAKSASQRFVVGPLNLLGGAVMGFVLITLWIAIILGAVQFVFQPVDVPVGQYTGASTGIVGSLMGSKLVPLFNQVLQILSLSVNWFIPKNADILKRVLGFIE